MYALDSLMKETFKRGLTKEKIRYCNSVPFKDTMMNRKINLIGIASVGMLCQKVVFESINDEC